MARNLQRAVTLTLTTGTQLDYAPRIPFIAIDLGVRQCGELAFWLPPRKTPLQL